MTTESKQKNQFNLTMTNTSNNNINSNNNDSNNDSNNTLTTTITPQPTSTSGLICLPSSARSLRTVNPIRKIVDTVSKTQRQTE